MPTITFQRMCLILIFMDALVFCLLLNKFDDAVELADRIAGIGHGQPPTGKI